MSRIRLVLFGSTLVAYAATVVAVLASTALVRLDWQVMLFRPYKQWPRFHAFLDYFVVLGQRGPTAVLVAAWLAWRTWKHRSLRPLLVLGTSLLLLNITVGAVKYGLGRLGPHYATSVGSAELFMGGDIFPSGHTANAVVTWGVLAYLASTPAARRVGSVISALLAMGVGMTTIYLGTHWVSDVLSGWCAGLLVLLALPWFEPAVARAEQWLLALLRRLRILGSPAQPSAPTTPPVPVPEPALAPAGDGTPPHGTLRPGAAAPRSGTHHVRPHAARFERGTPPPTAGRRPHPERPARPATPPLPVVRGRGGAV